MFDWIRSLVGLPTAADKAREHQRVEEDVRRRQAQSVAHAEYEHAVDTLHDAINNGFKDRIEKTTRIDRQSSDPTANFA